MTVPETPVNEHGGLKSRQNNVGLTRQFFAAKREPEPAPMQQRPDPPFRGCVLALDAAHVPTAPFRRDPVHIALSQRNAMAPCAGISLTPHSPTFSRQLLRSEPTRPLQTI